MTDFADISHEKRLLHLAGLEVDCPGIEIEQGVYSGCDTRGGTLTDCPECHGGGKVPRFPMLRRRCADEDGAMTVYIVDTLKALMEAAATFPDWAVGRWGLEEPVMAEVDGWAGEGATPADALSLALCKAMEGEKAEKEVRP